MGAKGRYGPRDYKRPGVTAEMPLERYSRDPNHWNLRRRQWNPAHGHRAKPNRIAL